MLKSVVIAACICLFACEVLPAQRNRNPATIYGTLSPDDNDFSIAPPQGPPGCDNRRNFQSMSPDTWGKPNALDPSAKSVLRKDDEPVQSAAQNQTGDVAGSATANEQSESRNEFQSASFSRTPSGAADNSNFSAAARSGPTDADASDTAAGRETFVTPILNSGPDVPAHFGRATTGASRYPLFKDQDATDQNDSIIRSPAAPRKSVLASDPPLSYPVDGSLAMPEYRPGLGHRSELPTIRHWQSEDNGQRFDHENKKKESPGLAEIFATGKWFGSATMLYLKPAFQSNTAISTSVTGISTPFDFDYEAAPQFQLGFESKHGPGFEFTTWQYDETSNASMFTSDGIDVGSTSAFVPGFSPSSQLSAANAGETLTAFHTLDAESFGLCFFKEIKFPVSRLNGKFGLQYVAITHVLDARLTDSGNTEIGNYVARSDMHAWGPQIAFEYFRPIGHTKFEFMTRFGGSALFGHQDQFVQNSSSGVQSRLGADELVTAFDFYIGGQYRRSFAENRAMYVRAGLMFQSWLGGGTAILPEDDFGLRGFSITLGYNR